MLCEEDLVGELRTVSFSCRSLLSFPFSSTMTPLLLRLPILLLALCSSAVGAASQSLYRISTLSPLDFDPTIASASEWSLDFSTADPSSGAVTAQVFAPDFQRWHYPQPMPALPFRFDTSARINGLESLMLFHHQPKLGGEVFRFAEDTNSSTFVYPAPQLPPGFSHVMYDERMDLLLMFSCDLVDASTNRWNVSLWTADDDQYEQCISIWSTELEALPGAEGADGTLLSIVGYNDELALLSFYFPTAADGGSITTLSVQATLNWKIVATVVNTIPWHSQQLTKHNAVDDERAQAEQVIDALNARKQPFPAVHRPVPSVVASAFSRRNDSAKGLPTTQSPLLGFASTRQPASVSSSQGLMGWASSGWIGYVDVQSGSTIATEFDFSSWVAPRLSWHRSAQELLVVEWAQPWRYARWNNQTSVLSTGTLQFEGGDNGQTLLGIYPLDG